MFLTHAQLRYWLERVIEDKTRQGHVTDGLPAELAAIPDSYDALHEFAQKLASLPMRSDWPFVEPNDWDAIRSEMDRNRASDPIAHVDIEDAAQRVEAAFLASVCGCILGKPLEIRPTLEELRAAFERIGEWPIRDYVSERVLSEGKLREFHWTWDETVRERIRYAAPDDDINYTIAGMLLLEKHGLELLPKHVRDLWMVNIPPGWSWGPERTMVVKAGADSRFLPTDDLPNWVNVLNPGDELCGAMIRADAYGYACPGRPELAAELAWRDASFTHRRTGIYGTMFAAAAISTAFIERDRLQVFDTALRYVPQKSRFYKIVSDALNDVAHARDWLDGYQRIHSKYAEYGHCRVYQESGTLINTLRFAENVGDVICKQVMQGNDTDSYGATAGSILGAFFGPGYLEHRWLAPFNDTIHVTLAEFHEQRLSAVAKRMSALPGLIADALAERDLRDIT